jgi:hypothetical protein
LLQQLKQRRKAMRESKKGKTKISNGWWYGVFILVGCFVLSGAVAGQGLPVGVSAPVPTLPAALGVRPNAQFTPVYDGKTSDSQSASGSSAVLTAGYSEPSVTPGAARRITLEEAQMKAATPANPLVRLGQLQVEVARQNRLGVISTFFPQIGSTFENMHFNKFLGQEIEVNRPLMGTMSTFGVPLFGKDQTFVGVTATQPITPLFQLRQVYKIALADERIARAKAGMPVAETADNLEKNYYGLLVAQRQLALAQAEAKETENKWLLASNSAQPAGLGTHDEELIESSNALAIATTKEKE